MIHWKKEVVNIEQFLVCIIIIFSLYIGVDTVAVYLQALQCRLKAALCPSLSLSLFLLQQCKSERASSVASERGKLDKHSQIPCNGCDCVCACLCLRTGCVFVTAIVHTWKTISNCDFEYCRLTNLCLNNCLFRIKVTHTKQLTKIKNRCAGTHTHTHARTHGHS